MITPAYAVTMAAYNSEMNRRLYAAAGRLSDDARRLPRGAFFGSIHGTLCHLQWADLMWMSRFDGWAKPAVAIGESAALIEDFSELGVIRAETDAKFEVWVATLDQAWIDGRQAWFSGALQRDMEAGRAGLLMHLFNHQTHHRGQVHAMLTAAGETTGDTDLFIVL